MGNESRWPPIPSVFKLLAVGMTAVPSRQLLLRSVGQLAASFQIGVSAAVYRAKTDRCEFARILSRAGRCILGQLADCRTEGKVSHFQQLEQQAKSSGVFHRCAQRHVRVKGLPAWSMSHAYEFSGL